VLQPGITGQSMPKGFLCPDGSFLSGLALKLTDRVTALYATCQTTTIGGLWGADAPSSNFVVGDATPYDVPLDCPRDYFIAGLGYVTGHYRADANGMAQPEIGRLVADLRPVCRLQGGAPYRLNRNFLVDAEDNDLQETFWEEGNPRDCPAGMAAVGVAVSYDGTPGLDPADRFYDVGLYCRPLPRVRKGIDTVGG
jgi:hypothetical protein